MLAYEYENSTLLDYAAKKYIQMDSKRYRICGSFSQQKHC